jgi:hypothetical protein
VLCAIRYEGWAADDAAARRLLESGRVTLGPCHHAGAVGPMTGIITASMPVFVVENHPLGNRAHATVNEGLGKVLRTGANDESGDAPLLGADEAACCWARRCARRAAWIFARSRLRPSAWATRCISATWPPPPCSPGR